MTLDHFQSPSTENNNHHQEQHQQQQLQQQQQRLGGKLPSLNGGPKSAMGHLTSEKAADRERAALLPSVSGGGGGGGNGKVCYLIQMRRAIDLHRTPEDISTI